MHFSFYYIPHELATPQSRNKRYERTKSSKGENIQFNAAHALLELQVAEIDNEETLFDVEKSDQSHCTFKSSFWNFVKELLDA
jgi:hypothetical protein